MCQNAAAAAAELLEALQGYLDGGYLYPRRMVPPAGDEHRPAGRAETWPATGHFPDYTAGLGVDELSALFSRPKEHPADFTLGRRACWSYSPAPERSTLRRSFCGTVLRLPPRGPLCYNGRESEARYP